MASSLPLLRALPARCRLRFFTGRIKEFFFSFLISRRVDGVDWRIRGDGYERGLIIVWIGREILSLRGAGFVKLKCVNGLSLLRREKDICWFIQARSADAKSFQNSRHYG